MVAHTCNPSYMGGRDQGDCGSRLGWAKMKARPYFKNTQHSWPPVAHICDPSYMGGRDQKD
jgi:hypothetical protein